MDQTVTGNGAGADFTISPEKVLFIEDIIHVNGATVNSVSNSFVQTAVPEPGTMMLLGFGLVGLAGFRKKIKS